MPWHKQRVGHLDLRPVAVTRYFLRLIPPVTLAQLITAATVVPLAAAVDLADLDDWRIVVAPGAIASEEYAAEELRAHLVLAGGPELQILSAPEGPGGHFFIGPDAASLSPAGFDPADYGPEDLRIVVRPGAVVVAGGRPRGTLYGVYTFLEDYLGVRFVTADHTHVPPLGPERRIEAVDRVYRPPLEWRWSDFESNYARADFAARLRLNAGRVECPAPGQRRLEPGGPLRRPLARSPRGALLQRPAAALGVRRRPSRVLLPLRGRALVPPALRGRALPRGPAAVHDPPRRSCA